MEIEILKIDLDIDRMKMHQWCICIIRICALGRHFCYLFKHDLCHMSRHTISIANVQIQQLVLFLLDKWRSSLSAGKYLQTQHLLNSFFLGVLFPLLTHSCPSWYPFTLSRISFHFSSLHICKIGHLGFYFSKHCSEGCVPASLNMHVHLCVCTSVRAWWNAP